MTGVGFGLEDSLLSGNVPQLIDGINPLDILFEGDDDEEEDEESQNSNFGSKKNSYGSERFPNFNDFEPRFDINDRKNSDFSSSGNGEVDRKQLKSEIAMLINDIGRVEEENASKGNVQEDVSTSFGSRKDRRAKKRSDYDNAYINENGNNIGGERGFGNQGGSDDYAISVSNMMREINKNDDEIRNEKRNKFDNQNNQNNNQNGNSKVDQVMGQMGYYDNNENVEKEVEFQMYDLEVEEEVVEGGEGEGQEAEITSENNYSENISEEEEEEDYSLIGDD